MKALLLRRWRARSRGWGFVRCPDCRAKLMRTWLGYRCGTVWHRVDGPAICGYSRHQPVPPHYILVASVVSLLAFGTLSLIHHVDRLIASHNLDPNNGIQVSNAPRRSYTNDQ